MKVKASFALSTGVQAFHKPLLWLQTSGIALVASAQSALLTVEETFQRFNGVSQYDFNSSQEVEGRLYDGDVLTDRRS